MPTEHGYTRTDDGSVTVSAADQATLDQLLLQRVIAKRTRDFDQADKLRDQLREVGCFVDDKMSTYRMVVPRSAQQDAPYTRDPADDSGVDLDPANEEMLVRRLGDRLVAKRTRDFDAADSIRDELQEVAKQCGCRLFFDDRARTYRFGRIVDRTRQYLVDNVQIFEPQFEVVDVPLKRLLMPREVR